MIKVIRVIRVIRVYRVSRSEQSALPLTSFRVSKNRSGLKIYHRAGQLLTGVAGVGAVLVVVTAVVIVGVE